MTFIAVFLLGAAALVLLGVLIGRTSVPDRGPRKAELNRARKALADLDALMAGASLELSMLGSDVANQGSDILRNYWRGDSK